MKKQIIINKDRLCGLYGKLILRIDELNNQVKGLGKDDSIPYPYVYEKLSRNFSMKKIEIKELLFFLRDIGFLEVNRRGIKLNFIIKNE